MHIFPGFIDMAKSAEELVEDRVESVAGTYPQNLYPYGLCLCLDHETIEKLGMETDVDAGDHIAFSAIGKVTSVSKRDTDKGPDCRIEIQITHVALPDMEEGMASMHRVDYKKMYNAEE